MKINVFLFSAITMIATYFLPLELSYADSCHSGACDTTLEINKGIKCSAYSASIGLHRKESACWDTIKKAQQDALSKCSEEITDCISPENTCREEKHCFHVLVEPLTCELRWYEKESDSDRFKVVSRVFDNEYQANRFIHEYIRPLWGTDSRYYTYSYNTYGIDCKSALPPENKGFSCQVHHPRRGKYYTSKCWSRKEKAYDDAMSKCGGTGCKKDICIVDKECSEVFI